MQTASEFMETFLRESAVFGERHRLRHRALNEKFYSEECLEYPSIGFRKLPSGALLSTVVTAGDIALACTLDPRTREKSRRYHLRVRRGKWEIHALDSWCSVCKGTGNNAQARVLRMANIEKLSRIEHCLICGGSGWRNELLVSKPEGKKA
jgi:hypothetical protein